MSTRTVTLPPPGGKAVTSLTEYAYDASGRLSGMSLPDGSMLAYRRNAQGQVVALERHRIRTPWLRWFQAPELIVKDLERDIVGLRAATYGNGVRARYLRSAQGVLARVDYRAPPRATPAAGMTLALSVLSGTGPATAAPGRAWTRTRSGCPAGSSLSVGRRRQPAPAGISGPDKQLRLRCPGPPDRQPYCAQGWQDAARCRKRGGTGQ
jgi:YD repeat-containing protein